jgi:hypothetical protein
MDIELIFAGPLRLKSTFKDAFKEKDGITDSINFCLKNIKIPHFKNLLNLLTRPQFLTDYIEQMHSIIDLNLS